MTEQLVTIIIPTYKDWGRLRLCISALERQTYPAALTQVIIVNNAPADQPPTNYLLPTHITIIDEAKPGSYAARNAALKLAKGDIIGFTDSDCIPLENWIASAVEVFNKYPEADRIAGRVEIFFAGSKPTPTELYESVYSFHQENSAMNGTCVTANMFTRKKVLETVGPFNDSLLSGGDIEWAMRARAKGFAIKYSVETAVKHPARQHLKQIINKSRRVASGMAQISENNYLKEFIRLLYKLKPSIKEWQYIKSHANHLSLYQRFLIFQIKWLTNFIKILERLRVLNGGKPYNDII